MEYTDFRFEKIKFKNSPETTPKVTVWYNALPLDDEVHSRKDAKDKFEELPHADFRDVWGRLRQFWKANLSALLIKEDASMKWGLDHQRLTTVRLDWEEDRIMGVRYFCEVYDAQGRSVNIGTPAMQPSVYEGEMELLEDLCSEVKNYLHGARDQQSLDFAD